MTLKLSARDQLIAVGLGAVLLIALAILLVLRPQFSELASLKQEQQVERDKLADAKLKLQRLDAIVQDGASIEAQRIHLSRRLPKDAELPSLIIDLQKVANSADLDLNSIEIGDEADNSGYASIDLKLSAKGTFYSMVDFLYRLEKMTREVVVSELSLKAGVYPDLSIEITAKTFKVTKNAPIPPPPGSDGQAAP